MRILERLSIQLERYPWAALYRILIGYAVVPLYKVLGGSSHDWGVFLFFVAILFGLRVGPMVLRKIMRFSREAHTAWKYRRYLAKRYDSYQWQKVFWFGVGIGLYVWVSNSFNSAAGILALISLVSGAAGLIFWKKHSAPVEAPSANG